MHRFSIDGHPNLQATHTSTIEFTKDAEVTLKGDCITGINSTFDKSLLRNELAYPKVRVTLSCGRERFTFYATPNKQFDDDNELVFRKGDFISKRTGGIYATRASSDIPLQMRQALQRCAKCTVTITGVPIQYIFFDFDDTVCDFLQARTYCHETVSRELANHYHLQKQRVKELLDTADLQFPKQASAENNVSLFDRHKWFAWIMKKMDKPMMQRECNQWVKRYWDCMISHSNAVDMAAETLAILKKKYRLGMITDADGKKEYKNARILHSGLSAYFDAFVLGDELQVVKPNRSMFLAMLSSFKAMPEQCVMIGDKPWGDLLQAKKLGMMTVWVKHGAYANQVKQTPEYVDYTITNLEELCHLF